MTAAGRGRVVLVVGALAQLTVWLVLRPDLAGPQWTEGSSLQVWLALEAVLAAAVGIVAPDRSTVARTVVLGWLLQALHVLVLGEHYDDTLWGVAVLVEVILAGAMVGLALLVRRVTGWGRVRTRN